ncbi:MAG: hypothetical protein NWR72_06505, partial [Bacteroidia bacterium]|nr:hypothetical protein [Bacteroidia bacterium]
MNKLQQTFAIALLLFFSGCAYYGDFPDEAMSATEQAPEASTGNIQPQPGIITAGEWNDLDHWDFWTQLLKRPDFERFPAYWQFYTNHRVSVVLASGETPVVNARVELFEGDNLVWAAKTDHAGQAELWIDLFQRSESVNLQDYVLRVNGVPVDHKLSLYENGVNRIQMRSAQLIGNRVDLSFIVDATGSMGDELEFLKDDLENVIRRVEANNTKLDIYTSSVFYRDQGDKYVVRKSDFSDDLSTTLDFINKQSADGGGDFPEAV